MTKNTTTLKNIPTNDVCYLSDEHLDKILSGIDTSSYPKFKNASECVYYMQITGMSLGDFLRDCANRAKEHYFDTVMGKDLMGLEEIQSSIRENCELLGELTDCDALEEPDSIIEDVIGEQVPYTDDDMTEYYEDSDEVMGWKYYHIY